MAKTVYAQHALHQSFLDMQCMKGGNIRAFLENLELKPNELTAAGVTITDMEFEFTVLWGIPNWLATYTSQLLGTTILNDKPYEMSDVIHILSEEADHVKTRNASKEQPQAKGRNAAQTPESRPDEALAVTSTSEGVFTRRRPGKCHHCGKEGHWAHKCCTKKREEAAAAAAANLSGQSAQASRVTKPENRPVGSANAVFNDDLDGDGDGFWFVGVDVAHMYPYFVEPDPDPLMSDDEDEEPFHAETCCAKDENVFDWFGFEDRLIKEGEEWDIDEEARPSVAAARAGLFQKNGDNKLKKIDRNMKIKREIEWTESRGLT